MNINATLLGQMITFLIFVWFTMKFVWPMIVDAMNEREQKIAEGLAASERGLRDLDLAQEKISEQLRNAKVQASEILDTANRRASQIVEDAQAEARKKGQRLLEVAQEEIHREVTAAKQALRGQVADIAVLGAQKILGRQIDKAANNDLLEKLIEEL